MLPLLLLPSDFIATHHSSPHLLTPSIQQFHVVLKTVTQFVASLAPHLIDFNREYISCSLALPSDALW